MPLKDNEEGLVYSYSNCDNGAYIEWNSKDWAPLVKNLTTSKTKCSIYFRKESGIEYIKELPIVESGDGLYKVEHKVTEIESAWNQIEYRYAGANPKNYVKFNNEIWRIIGVVNVKTNNGIEQRIKIIRLDGINGQQDFGAYSWDYKSEIGYNNDWTTSTLKNMLNGIYYNSESGDCYKGEVTPQTCDFTQDNGNPKGLDETARNMIDKEVIWNLGGFSSKGNILTSVFYEQEREKNKINKPNEWTKDNDKEYHNGIGLMYVSDYGYAVGGESRQACLEKTIDFYYENSCKPYDWLKQTSSIKWFYTPFNDLQAFNLGSNGRVYWDIQVNYAFDVLPVVYLNSNVKIQSNENLSTYGSFENPFILE